ncbi:MAG TPA: YIP1 family protein [Anaerolineae bacterium]
MTTSAEAIQDSDQRPLWQLLFGIIDRPNATFKSILARPQWTGWLAPLLFIIIAFAIFTAVQTPYSLELAREQAERQLASLPAEQAEAARAGMEVTMSLPVMLATGIGFGSLALIIGLIAQTAFLYFTALVAGGDDLEFGPLFIMSTWTRLPAAIGFLTQAGYIFMMQRMIDQPGLSFLVATGDLLQDARNPLYLILGRLDIVWLWHLLLVVVGLSVAARMGRGKSLLLTLLYAALTLGLTVLPSLIFGGAFGG